MKDYITKRPVLYMYVFFFGITIILWLLAKPSLSILTRFPTLAFAQIAGLLATVLVGLNMVLASRFSFINDFLGGLDKAYKQHGMTGRLAFFFMILHPLFIVSRFLPSAEAMLGYILNFSVAAETFGKIALVGFVTLIVLTIYVKLPYHIWRRTHQLMIVPMVFVALHTYTISSDIAVYMPLRLWILAIIGVGIASYVYKVILYKYIGPKYKYRIDEVNPKGEVTEIVLSPLGKKLAFEPGQFIFAIFNSMGLTTEEHPFSVSSSPNEETIRISAKQSGDYTKILPTVLSKGDTALIYGPYGFFGQEVIAKNKQVVMVAGGIGITPFLSIVRFIAHKNLKRRFDLFYVYHDKKDGVYKNELTTLVSSIKSGKFFQHISSKDGRITADRIASQTDKIRNKIILLCGPKGMMDALTTQFVALGVPRKNIIFEDFNLKQ